MAGPRRILVIEDDAAIRRGVVDALRSERYDVAEAGNGTAGLDLVRRGEFDLMLLDLVLPGADGMDILRETRALLPTMPIIILTARGDERDRIEGLKRGADDYIVKPFSLGELLARVEAVIRRTPQRPLDVDTLQLPGATVDFARQAATRDGQTHELSQRELELLRYLAQHRSRAVSREEILENVWRIDAAGVETRTIDMHINRLRRKLGDDAILTVRGKGYALAP